MWLTAITRGLRCGVVLPALDRLVHPELGVGLLSQAVERARQARGEPPGIGLEAAAMNAPLGNDHVVVPCVDQPDRAVV